MGKIDRLLGFYYWKFVTCNLTDRINWFSPGSGSPWLLQSLLVSPPLLFPPVLSCPFSFPFCWKSDLNFGTYQASVLPLSYTVLLTFFFLGFFLKIHFLFFENFIHVYNLFWSYSIPVPFPLDFLVLCCHLSSKVLFPLLGPLFFVSPLEV